MIDESYLPRQQQLQNLAPEMSIMDDPSNLQNEKKDISLELQKLNADLRHKQAAFDALPQTQSDPMSQDGSLKDLRQKTNEVEELSMKMDELYQMNNNLEMLISKIKRYNVELYKESMGKDTMELRRLIGVSNKELEAFPRQNKNCIEYYEKYKLKYEELDSKFT